MSFDLNVGMFTSRRNNRRKIIRFGFYNPNIRNEFEKLDFHLIEDFFSPFSSKITRDQCYFIFALLGKAISDAACKDLRFASFLLKLDCIRREVVVSENGLIHYNILDLPETQLLDLILFASNPDEKFLSELWKTDIVDLKANTELNVFLAWVLQRMRIKRPELASENEMSFSYLLDDLTCHFTCEVKLYPALKYPKNWIDAFKENPYHFYRTEKQEIFDAFYLLKHADSCIKRKRGIYEELKEKREYALSIIPENVLGYNYIESENDTYLEYYNGLEMIKLIAATNQQLKGIVK